MSALPLAAVLGTTELLIILGIVLLLFGAKRLPDLARSMGKSVREFRSATDEADQEQDEPATSDKTES